MPHGDIDIFQDRAKGRVRRGILECKLSVGQEDFNGFDTKRRARGGFFRLCLFRNGGFVFGGGGGRLSAPFLLRRINSSGDFTSTLPRLSVFEKTSSESIAAASKGKLISGSLSRSGTAK